MHKEIKDNNIDLLLDLYNKLKRITTILKSKYNYTVTVKFKDSNTLEVDGEVGTV